MDIFGPVDSIYADVAAEHPTQLTDAHLGVTAKMHHARADGSKLHEASLRDRTSISASSAPGVGSAICPQPTTELSLP
jgi:hypothetical protein